MENKTISSVIFLIIVATLGYAIFKNNQNLKITEEITEKNIEIEEVQKVQKTIDLKYKYKEGKNIFVGTIDLKNSCDKFFAEISDEGTEKQINLLVQENSVEENCEEIETKKTFRIEILGEKDENVLVALNGELVNLNISPISENEDIDEIETYEKK